jgi:hypothetical protein
MLPNKIVFLYQLLSPSFGGFPTAVGLKCIAAFHLLDESECVK